MSHIPSMADLLGADTPSNWGRWGHLDTAEVLRGVRHIRTGEVFTLQIQMGHTDGPGDPLWPGREGIKGENVLDESTWDGEGAPLKVVNGTGAPVNPVVIR